jgi:hypothetical protein
MGDVTDADIDQMLYSVDGEATDADIDQMIASSGVYDDASNLPDGYTPGIPAEENLPGDTTIYSAEDLVKDMGWEIRSEWGQTGFEDYDTQDIVYDGLGDRVGELDSRGRIIFDKKSYGQALSDSGVVSRGKFETNNDSLYWLPENGAKTTTRTVTEPGTQVGKKAGMTANNLTEARVLSATQSGEGPQRQWGSIKAQESDELDEKAKEWLLNNSTYERDSNAAQLDRAIEWIHRNRTEGDEDGYHASLAKVMSKNFDYRSADGQARLFAVMGLAVAHNDVASQVALGDFYNRAGTTIAQANQARKLFRLMTPQGRVVSLQKMVQQINDTLANRGYDVENGEGVKLSEWIYRAAAAAKEEGDYAKVLKAAKAELADQTPATWQEKFIGFRMLSMLSAPTTHIRNTLGNLAMVPIVGSKNKVGALGEIIAQKAGFIQEGERTKTLGLATPEARRFAKEYLKTVKDQLDGNKYEDSATIQQKDKKLYGTGKGIISKTAGKLLQAAYTGNSLALEWEDTVFLNLHFRNAMAGYMTANKLTAADMKGATLERATEYAINEAQKATFHDASKVASWLNSKDRPEAMRFLVDAIQPFKKTPINIGKRGIDYSPIGLVRGLTYDAVKMAQYVKATNANKPIPKGAISPTQWIDRVAAGATGIGLTALGVLFGRLGLVNAGFDDDDPDDLLKKAKGEQEYAINPGKMVNKLFGVDICGEDATYTIDWAAPANLSFFVGAAISDVFDGEEQEDGGNSIVKIMDAILSITEPMYNLTMMEGLTSALETNQYETGNVMTKMGEKILMNWASSYIPSLVGKGAKLIDPTRRMTYIPSGENFSTVVGGLEKMQNKIPFYSRENMPWLDVKGEEQVKDGLGGALETLFSPGYIAKIDNSDVMNEIERLYKSTKNTKIIPQNSDYSKSITISDKEAEEKTIKLTDAQFYQLKKTQGTRTTELIDQLIQRPEYAIYADDATRASMIEDLKQYARKTAQHEIDDRVAYSGNAAWIAAAEENGNVIDTVINRATEKNRKLFIVDRGYRLAKAMDNDHPNEAQNIFTEMQNAGITNNEIRSELSEYFRDRYKDAYIHGRKDEANTIRYMLEEANVGYEASTFTSWEKQARNKYNNVNEPEEDEDILNYRDWLKRKQNFVPTW